MRLGTGGGRVSFLFFVPLLSRKAVKRFVSRGTSFLFLKIEARNGGERMEEEELMNSLAKRDRWFVCSNNNKRFLFYLKYI